MCAQCYGVIEAAGGLLVTGRLWYVSSVKPRLGRRADDEDGRPEEFEPVS